MKIWVRKSQEAGPLTSYTYIHMEENLCPIKKICADFDTCLQVDSPPPPPSYLGQLPLDKGCSTEGGGTIPRSCGEWLYGRWKAKFVQVKKREKREKVSLWCKNSKTVEWIWERQCSMKAEEGRQMHVWEWIKNTRRSNKKKWIRRVTTYNLE